MSLSPHDLIDRFLDDGLSDTEQASLSEWIRADAQHAAQFAAAMMLHDRIRNELSLRSEPVTTTVEQMRQNPRSWRHSSWQHSSWRRSWMAMIASVAAIMMIALLLWKDLGENTASAAGVELQRILEASSQVTDHTLAISLEEAVYRPKRKSRDERKKGPVDSERVDARPPKPSIDGAVLHVRGPDQFVLVRKISDNEFFITGSDGKIGWAVRPDGPVRVSSDPTHFNHDVPGHEHSMPLSDLRSGLEQLRAAYDIEVAPAEIAEEESNAEEESSRLLIAVKRRGFRGPRRVEITYGATTGRIQQMRLIDMPYGPEQLTLRMTLVEQHNLGETFFHHESHHSPDRNIEWEE